MENIQHPVTTTVDIDATKALLDLVFSGVQCGQLAAADKKLDFSDVMYLPPVLASAGVAVPKLKEIPTELGSVSDEEGKLILAHAATRLPGLVGEELARKVSAALKVGVAIAEAVAAFKGVQVSFES